MVKDYLPKAEQVAVDVSGFVKNLSFADTDVQKALQTIDGMTPMVYPSAGIPISTGSTWGTSIPDNHANWDTAYSSLGSKANIDQTSPQTFVGIFTLPTIKFGSTSGVSATATNGVLRLTGLYTGKTEALSIDFGRYGIIISNTGSPHPTQAGFKLNDFPYISLYNNAGYGSLQLWLEAVDIDAETFIAFGSDVDTWYQGTGGSESDKVGAYYIANSEWDTYIWLENKEVEIGGNLLINCETGDISTTGIGSFGSIKILEGGLTPTKYTIFQGGDQSADITYTLPTALPSSSKFLQCTTGGVLSWETVVSGGTWGSITGTLSNQTDLQNALNAKVNLDQTSPQTITASPIFNWGSENAIPFYSSSKTLTHDTEFYYNPTTRYLGLGAVGTGGYWYKIFALGRIHSGQISDNAVIYNRINLSPQDCGFYGDSNLTWISGVLGITGGITTAGSIVSTISQNGGYLTYFPWKMALTMSGSTDLGIVGIYSYISMGTTGASSKSKWAIEGDYSLSVTSGSPAHSADEGGVFGLFNIGGSNTATITNAYGVKGQIKLGGMTGGGAITNAYGGHFSVNPETIYYNVTPTNSYGVYIGTLVGVNKYGIYITNNGGYAIYSAGGNVDLTAGNFTTTGTLGAGVGTLTSLNLKADSNQIVLDSDGTYTLTLTGGASASSKTITFPNATGMVALTSDLSGYIPTIADPNINALFGWDDTDNAYKFIALGTGLSYDHSSHTLSLTGVATTALSNLGSVAINTSLLSDTDATDDLGSGTYRWKDLYLSGVVYVGSAWRFYQNSNNLVFEHYESGWVEKGRYEP